MKKWLLVLLLSLASFRAWATCEPSQATAGMIGCWPQVTTMPNTDSIDIWQPGQFPASANRIHKQDMMHVAPPIGDVTPNVGVFTNLDLSTATSSITLSGQPFISAPMGSVLGPFTIVGINAGIGVNPSAIEATIVGYCAGGSQCRGGSGFMSGTENTLGGWYSGTSLTTGHFITAWGVNTVGAETIGNNLVAFGVDAMRNTVALQNSVAVGAGAIATTSLVTPQNGLTAIGNGAIAGNSALAGSFITGVGVGAVGCANCTTANFVVGVGDFVLANLTTGSGLAFLGSSAGRNVDKLINSVGIGDDAIETLQLGGSQNGLTAVGNAAIEGNASMTGSFITAIGVGAVGCANCTTAQGIVGVGDEVLTNVTTGSALAFVGSHGGAAITTSFNSTGMGSGVMTNLTTGAGVSGFGYEACNGLTTNGDTSCFGQIAGNQQSGGENSFFGSRAVSAASGSGNFISAFGYETGLNASGSLLTLIGAGVASTTLTTGTGNIIIGVDTHADVPAGSSSNMLIIQGAGTTPTITATGLIGSSPAVTIPGTLNVVQGISANGNAGISGICVASGGTLTITNGLITGKSGC